MTSLTACSAAVPTPNSIGDYWALLKPRVMALVVFTGMVGLWLAPVALHPLRAVLVIIALAVGAGASGALNMWYDRDIDAIMDRTRHRPIPAGRIDPSEALGFGVVLTIFSVLFMGMAGNWAAAGWLAFVIWFYAHFYTVFLKRTTAQNIVIGGLAGSLPPLVTWVAATNQPFGAALAWVMVAIIFFWTPAHFWALALLIQNDYRRVGVPMLPLTHGESYTRRMVLLYAVVTAVAVAMPFFVAAGAGLLYLVTTTILSVVFIKMAYCLWRDATAQAAKRMFLFSIAYLFGVFLALVVDHGVWMLFAS